MYIHGDYHDSFILSLHIPHELWTPNGEGLLNFIFDFNCILNTYYLLIGYEVVNKPKLTKVAKIVSKI